MSNRWQYQVFFHMSNLEFPISCCCHFWLQFRFVVGTVVCFNFTSGPSGRTGRLWAAATGRHWRRGCRRRVSALLLSDYGLRIRSPRGGGPIRGGGSRGANAGQWRPPTAAQLIWSHVYYMGKIKNTVNLPKTEI